MEHSRTTYEETETIYEEMNTMKEFIESTRLIANVDNIYNDSLEEIRSFIVNNFDVVNARFADTCTETDAIIRQEDYMINVIVTVDNSKQTFSERVNAMIDVPKAHLRDIVMFKIPKMTSEGYFIIGGIKRVPSIIETSIREDVVIVSEEYQNVAIERDDDIDGMSEAEMDADGYAPDLLSGNNEQLADRYAEAESCIKTHKSAFDKNQKTAICRLKFPQYNYPIHAMVMNSGDVVIGVTNEHLGHAPITGNERPEDAKSKSTFKKDSKLRNAVRHYPALEFICSVIDGTTDTTLSSMPIVSTLMHLFADTGMLSDEDILLICNDMQPVTSIHTDSFKASMATTLCYMVLTAIIHSFGYEQNRNDYASKCLRTSGELIKLLVTSILISTRSQYGSKITNRTLSSIHEKLEARLFRTFRTGTIKMFGGSYSKMIMTLSERSSIDRIAALRKVAIPCDESIRSHSSRQIDPSQIGYICPCETPENVSVGLVKHLSLSCVVSSSFTITNEMIGYTCPTAVSIEKFLEDIKTKPTLITVNGVVLYASILSRDIVADQLFNLKRFYHPHISVTCNTTFSNIVSIRSSSGRPMSFDPATSLFFSPTEHIPSSLPHHCPIDSWMLGTSASMIPFLEHNHSARNVFACSMLKQALEMSTQAKTNCRKLDNEQSYTEEMKSNVAYGPSTFEYTTEYSQKPIVSTWLQECTKSIASYNGINLSVAIMTYEGMNQEDGIVINRSCVERGLFRTIKTLKHVVTLEKDQSMIKHNEPDGSVKYTVISENPGMALETVYVTYPGWTIYEHTYNDDERTYILIVQREHKDVQIGDKITSRHAQKGVIASIVDPCDMPFTTDGRSPDIIINPHAIPSRMTIGQILESIVSDQCLANGEMFEYLAFKYHSNLQNIKGFEEMRPEEIIDQHSNEVMINGKTGEIIHAHIFMGSVYYMALPHQAKYKSLERYYGPRNAVSKQPVSGKTREGGLRFGEMEHDVLIAHGVEYLINEVSENSDACVLKFCVCGRISQTSTTSSRCLCGKTEWEYRQVPFSTKLLIDTLLSCNIELIKE